MAKMGNDIMASGAGMSPRKAMASGMGEGKGNFGVGSFDKDAQMATNHPDKVAMTGAKGAMADHERGIGMPISRGKGMHPAQAAPDHGPTHPGGHGMGAYKGKI